MSDNLISAEMSELTCQPCKDEGLDLEAFGYCLDCSDYLCEDCYSGHLKPRPMRNHSLLDKEQMMKEKDILPSKDIVVDKCQPHSKKIKYFCPVHDSVGCSVCVTIEHKSCEDIVHIPQVAEGIAGSEELKTLEHEISETATRFENIIPDATANIATSEASKTKVTQEISTFIEDIIATIHKLETTVRSEADQCHAEDIRRMNSVILNAKESLNKMNNMRSSLVNLARMKQQNKLFIAVKTTSKELKKMQEELATSENENSVRVCNFYANPNFRKDVKRLERLGELSYDVIGPTDTAENSSTELNESSDPDESLQFTIKATHLKDFNIKFSADKDFYCNVRGLAAIANHRIVLVHDSKPSKVTLVDTHRTRIISELILPGSYSCFASINDSYIAVGHACADSVELSQRGIALLKIDRSFAVVRDIGSTNDEHISSFNNNVYICKGDNTIRKVTLDGRENETFRIDSQYNNYQGTGMSTTTTQNVCANAIYKSNTQLKSYTKIRQDVRTETIGFNFSTGLQESTNQTTSSTFLGHGVVGEWVTDKVNLRKEPKAITMGADGKLLFVLAGDVIYVVRVGTTVAHVLLGEDVGLHRVSAMSYCPSSRQLFVAMEQCNFIKIYQISDGL